MSGVTPKAPEGVIIKPHNPHYLDQLWNDAMHIQSKCMDVTVHDVSKAVHFDYVDMFNDVTEEHKYRKVLSYNPDKILSYGTLIDEDELEDTQMSYLTSHSFGQLCTKLGIPIRYMDKCEKAGRNDLVSANMNVWLGRDHREMLLRIHEKEIRGILGSRYTTLDAPDIIQAVAQTPFLRNAEVKGYMLDPTRLHIRLVATEPLKILGEDLFPGVTIDSSDVGKSSLRVQLFIYKQVCTNGLMLPTEHSSIFVQRHIGITLDEFSKGLANGLNECQELVLAAQDRLSDVVTAKSLTSVTRQDLLLKGPDKLLFSEDTAQDIIQLQETKYATNLWGLINAITEYAQRFSLERRLMFEEAAGRLLYLRT